MNSLFIASHLALWILVLIQSVVIVLVVRQVGFLHLRVRPQGARVMPIGPEIGALAPAATLQDIDDPSMQIVVSDDMESDVLLLFVSPGCAACALLIPAIKPLMRWSASGLRWAIVGSGGPEACHEFRKEYGLYDILFASDAEARKRFQIEVTPYAVLIRRDGIVFGKGLVNHIEHLESLLEGPTPSAKQHATAEHANTVS